MWQQGHVNVVATENKSDTLNGNIGNNVTWGSVSFFDAKSSSDMNNQVLSSILLPYSKDRETFDETLKTSDDGNMFNRYKKIEYDTEDENSQQLLSKYFNVEHKKQIKSSPEATLLSQLKK